MEDRQRSAKTMKEHRAMYDAIMSGNAELAMELTTQHIANAKIHMMKGVK
jgi:DNA-binding FadR family transcriptional regulator